MCKLVIDTGALTRNLEKLRHYTSARIIAVVKGGGYGLGLAPYAQWLTAQGVDMLAVSSRRRPPPCGTRASRRTC